MDRLVLVEALGAKATSEPNITPPALTRSVRVGLHGLLHHADNSQPGGWKSAGKKATCFTCHMEGHRSADCPTTNPQATVASPAPEKPSAPASATNKAWKSLGKKATCFKCGACCLGMARPPSIHKNCNMCK